MTAFLGWALIVAALALVVNGWRRRGRAEGGARGYLAGGAVALLAGIGLAVTPAVSQARLAPVDLSRQDGWVCNPTADPAGRIKWDGSALVAELEAGSGHYAAFPVDWNGGRFEASWDLAFERLDRQGDEITLTLPSGPTKLRRTAQDYASVTVGLMDQGAANIDDRDHVSGSAIEACFSDDIRLRASDSALLLRTSAADESGSLDPTEKFTPQKPLRLELHRRYRCRLSYRASTCEAELTVADEGGRALVRRKLEDLKEFSNNLAWFGVSIRGYNRYDKRLDPAKADTGYTRPRAIVRLENLRYAQP